MNTYKVACDLAEGKDISEAIANASILRTEALLNGSAKAVDDWDEVLAYLEVGL